MDIDSEQQIPATVEFTTYAGPLPSTMEIHAESSKDRGTDSDDSTSFMDVSSANAQVIIPADNDYHDHCNILYLSFVHAVGGNPDPRIVMMLRMRLLRP